MGKNIVITGKGIISSIGNNSQEVLDSLLKERTGIGTMQFLDSSHKELPVGEVKLSNSQLKSKLGIDDKYISRTTLLGIMAVAEAIESAELNNLKNFKDSKDSDSLGQGLRIVLISGTTVGGMDITENYYTQIVKSGEHSEVFLTHDAGAPAKRIADYFGFFSDYTTISTACSSAANAIILGANMIKADMANIVIAGGCESLSRFHLNGFNSLMILDKQNCRPFDRDREGLNLGEGAAYLVLESEEFAKRRNSKIEAYLLGYCNTCDAFHQTASSENGEGAFLSMDGALKISNLKPEEIDYINAHGTGTPNNDLTESAAVKRVFGDSIPLISSTKGVTGHTTSAAGSIEAVITLLALNNSFIPSNFGWKHKMDDGILPSVGIKRKEINYAISNSFGFGGNDSTLIFSKISNGSENSDFLKYPEGKIKVLSKVVIEEDSQLEEIGKYLKPLEARRMGNLMKSSLLSSLKALEIAGITTPDAIIFGTYLGCLENSEKFLEQMEFEGENLLKPTYFMQSTHNTLSSAIAIRTKCHGYNSTYTQGDRSFDWAYLDALLQLRSGRCKSVLIGYHNEITDNFRKALERVGKENLKPLYSLAMVLSIEDN